MDVVPLSSFTTVCHHIHTCANKIKSEGAPIGMLCHDSRAREGQRDATRGHTRESSRRHRCPPRRKGPKSAQPVPNPTWHTGHPAHRNIMQHPFAKARLHHLGLAVISVMLIAPIQRLIPAARNLCHCQGLVEDYLFSAGVNHSMSRTQGSTTSVLSI